MDLENINNVFKERLLLFLEHLAKNNLEVEDEILYVSPLDQAIIWRQGQLDGVIDGKIQELEDLDCKYLSHLLREARSAPGEFLSNSLPGCSWHNWGEAMTFNLYSNGSMVLPNEAMNDLLNKIAKKVKLHLVVEPKEYAVYYGIYLSENNSPLDQYTWQEIDKHVRETNYVVH